VSGGVAVLGVFVGDCAFRAERPPRMGETLLGKSFVLGPGGKGSNQAVAAARAGAEVRFVSKLGADAFADLARSVWAEAGVTPAVSVDAESYTGAAYIFIEDATGANAIIISPGVAGTIAPADVEARAEVIAEAKVFLTQLEQPLDAALRGLEIARAAGVPTILNPAPSVALPDDMLALCDIVTPNESEAEGLTGIAVKSLDDAERAADALIARGAGAAVITLGENGALYRGAGRTRHVPAMSAGPAVDTTGAGDAFNGALAAALAGGADPVGALDFATATAAISVTRPGAAASMPPRHEIDALMARRG